MKTLGLSLLVSCFALGVTTSEAATQKLPLSNLHEITIEALQSKFNNNDIHGIKLHLIQQVTEELQITAPDNLSEKIKVRTSNAGLSIEISPLHQKDVANGLIDIYIATKAANRIQVIGQVDMNLDKYETTENLEIDIQKGGTLKMNGLKAPIIHIKAAFGSEIQLTNLDSDQLKCSADFGAVINIVEASGVKKLEASSSFGGSINAPGLSANYGKFEASFGSSLHFNKVNDKNSSSSFGGDIQISN